MWSRQERAQRRDDNLWRGNGGSQSLCPAKPPRQRRKTLSGGRVHSRSTLKLLSGACGMSISERSCHMKLAYTLADRPMVAVLSRRYNAVMSKVKHISETPATQFLRWHKVAFGEHPYEYVEHGGTEESARQLGVDEHCVAKTLVMEDEHAKPLIVLMHGDKTVST